MTSIRIRTCAAGLLAALTLSTDARAQAPAPAPPGAPTRGFPEVHSDRSVTFKLAAPDAREASLRLQGVRPMARDERGLWSITVGPLEPEIYEYAFTVDGARVLDTANTMLKTGRALGGNLLEIPGTPPRFDEIQDVLGNVLRMVADPL